MTTQTFGIGTALDPAVSIGGVSHSMVFEFNRYPTNRVASPIVSGIIESVTSESGNIKRAVMRRAPQQSSNPSGGVEAAYSSEMGGNIAATPEPARIYSYLNDRAFRGADFADRVIKHDRATLTIGGVPRGFLVVSATPFAQAPSGGTNWAGSAPIPTPGSILHAPNSVILSTLENCETIFTPGSVDIYASCALTWRNSTAFTSGAVAARVFDGDATLYPDDATFDPAAQEYWFDARTLAFRFGTSGMGLVGADSVEAITFQRSTLQGIELTPATSARSLVVEATDTLAGYGGTDDELAAIGVSTLTDFDVVLDVLDATVGEDCAFEFRDGGDTDARVALLGWSGSGTVNLRAQRSTAGGSLSDLGETGGAYSYPFQVRATLTGSSLVFSHRQNSAASWVNETAITVAHAGGRLSVATTGAVRFSGVAVAARLQPVGTTSAAIAVESVQSFTGLAWSASYTLPNANAFVSIVNATTGAAMIPGTTATARNVYVRSGTGLVLFSESSGDRIDFVLAASGVAPTPPGTAPRAANTVNFIDGDERGNYHDVVEIHDPHDEIPLSAGQSVSFSRDPVFDSQDLPALEYDVKERTGSDWATLDASNYTIFAADGLIYIKAAFIAGLSLVPGESVCIRAVGSKFAQRGSISAEPFNDFVNAVEGLDAFSTGGGLGFAVGSSIGGLTDAGGGGYAPYPSGFTCDGTYWIPDDVVYGTHKTRFHGLSDALDADGSPFGSYFFDTTFNPPLSVRDTAERDFYLSADDTALPACSGAPKTAHDANAAGDFPFDITPLGNYNPSFIPFGMLAGGTLDPGAQYFGGHVLRSGYSYGYNAGVGAEFGFSGVGFAPAGFLTRLRDGAEIIEAWALMRAVGLKVCSWSQIFDLQPNGDLHLEYERDDASIIYDGPVTGGPVTTFDPGTPAGSSGSISLALVGRVRDSRNIRLVGGGTYPLAANTFQHLGSGLSISTVDADVFKKVSVKEAIQKLVATRNSLAADYELWPTVATVEPDDGAGALAGFLRGLMPVCSATLIPGSGSTWGYTSTQAGRYAIIPQGIEISAIRVRFRLPSGILADDVIATPQSAMIPGWS